MSLENLIEKRKKWIKSSQENNFDFDSILAGLYNDPSHFIYEILQNAEDAAAKTIRFELLEDKLDIHHDGRDFNFADIEGVTGIGISTKKSDLTAIGKFGVGFKSVFAVTETPYIYSGEYSIRIEDFVVPVETTMDDRIQGTLIRLLFNHKFRSKEAIYDLVYKKLENIGLKTLLFLRNIEEIKWLSPRGNGHYIKETKEINGAKRVTVISEKDSEEYIVIDKPIEIENKVLKVEVAYRLGKDKQGEEIVVQEPDSKLVVYFPTEKVTFLNFLIQGPYKTTPNRENIPLDDEQNKMIIQETGKLIAESLSVVKRLGYLDTNFLNLMPIYSEYKEKEPIYVVLYEKVKEKFLSDEELLPTTQRGIYTKPETALLARGKELTEFLSNEDIHQLFSKHHWLDTNITYDKTRELRDYLINELDIKEVDFEVFARNISNDFLQIKSDEWMMDFYSRLLDQESLWRDRGYKAGILRTKPIIRLDNDEHIEPFNEDGKAQVYLPSETRSKYKTVKRTLNENDDALKFLKELGLAKPDLFSEVNEFILPKYQAGDAKVDEAYYEDFEKLLTIYETISSNKKKDYVLQLSSIPFIDSTNRIRQDRDLHKPTHIYLSDSELEQYFADSDSIYFVSLDLYSRFGKERLTPFLQEIGIADSPRRIPVGGNLSWEEKEKLRGNTGYTRDIHIKDYDYEGLEIFLKEITSGKSILLWSLLLRCIKDLDGWKARDYFKGEYKWFYRTEHTASFDATFLKTLRQTRWLVNKEGNMFKPSEMTFSELDNEYIKESPNIEILTKELHFKPEIIDQLPPEDKKKYELTKNYTSEELEKILSEHGEKSGTKKDETGRGEEEWKPECRPDEVDAKIEKVVPVEIIISGLEGQPETLETVESKERADGGDSQPQKKVRDEAAESLSATNKKKIGKWGEEFVLNAFKKEYPQMSNDITATDSGFKLQDAYGKEIEIVWLNIKSNVGKGCDIVRKENGIEVEYIEVKTKLGSHEELIEITGKQWESARTLYNQGEGNKYSIYVVSNAGQSAAKIIKLNDPIRLWKEGKLYAHPINFKL
ncbi:MAG: DUF3883 domain-containing protein [Nitrospirota bacterium]